jgi:hypothetical protein
MYHIFDTDSDTGKPQVRRMPFPPDHPARRWRDLFNSDKSLFSMIGDARAHPASM